MKTKIFALIISILCLSMIFVACDQSCETHVDADSNGVCDNCEETLETESATETETETDTEEATEEQTIAPCDTHKDADADKICDGCERAIVVIVEQIPAEKETAVSMVVNPIPEEVTVEYVDHKLPTDEILKEATLIEGYHHQSDYKSYVFFTETTDELGISAYGVHSVIGDRIVTIFEGVERRVDNVSTTIAITEYADWFSVRTTTRVLEGVDFNTRSYTITNYTYAGAQIGETYTWSDEAVQLGTQVDYVGPVWDGEGNNGEAHVLYNDVLYVIDEDDAIVHTANPDTFVDRPTFTDLTDTHGYVVGLRDVHVYDLSKWIECVYVYTVPVGHMYADISVLSNGNLLVSSIVELAGSSVSYDFMQAGYKYDLRYAIINPVEKTETEVEFGYLVSGIQPVDTQFAFTAAAAEYNIAIVSPIVDGYIDQTDSLVLLVDNELNVLANLNNFLDRELVADNVYFREVQLGNGETISELVNEKGEHIDYISDDADIYAGYFQVGTRLYSYAGKLLIDLNDYDSSMYYGTYYHLTKAVYDELLNLVGYDHFIYVPGQESRQIEINPAWSNWYIACYDFGYVVYSETGVAPDEEVVMTAEFYNYDGTKVENLPNAVISGYTYVGDKLILGMNDGSVYVVE